MKKIDAQLFHKLSHWSYMFRHYCVILREFVVCTLLLKYTGLKWSRVFCVRVNIVVFLFCTMNQQMRNYFTNYHTAATCFDTIVSSSGSS